MAKKKDKQVEQAVNSIETKTKPLTGKAAEAKARKDAREAAKAEKAKAKAQAKAEKAQAKAAKKATKKAAKKNSSKKEGKEKLGFFARIAKFFRDYKSEFKKLVWPTRQQLAKNSAVVLVSIVICGTALWAIDYVLGDLLLPALYNRVGLILPM